MNVLQQFENGFHALLPQIEAGATYILAKSNDKVVLHRILQTGEVVSAEMNVPLLRNVLQAIDSAVPAQ